MSYATVAEVLVEVRTHALKHSFDYLVPADMKGHIKRGHRVYVSFAHRYLQGFVVGLQETVSPSPQLKPILAVLDETPLLNEELLALADWLVHRYACTRLEAISAMIPAAFRIATVVRYHAANHLSPDKVGELPEAMYAIWQSLQKRPQTLPQVTARFGNDAERRLKLLISAGFVTLEPLAKDHVAARTTPHLELLISPSELDRILLKKVKRAPKQADILRRLGLAASSDRPMVSVDELNVRASDPAVRALCDAELVKRVDVAEDRLPSDVALNEVHAEHVLTRTQQKALAAITEAQMSGQGAQLVLQGVTGSGKTEVYLQAIEQVLKLGKGAIVLVPEISLTPQMVGRFRARFGPLVAVLHSSLSVGEKRDEWLRVDRGEAKIVVGARSAIFAPVESLALLVVDEEHEPSYKQEESPRYDAREVALWRALHQKGLVIYGSATPSLQTMHQVEGGFAKYVSMPFRVNGRPLPPVTVVDMREELRQGNRSLFSNALQSGLTNAMDGGFQAILFLNRRGYASSVICRHCGLALKCPHCDISLTLHKTKATQWLECHYCSYHTKVPAACPDCNEVALRPFGIGTEQVEEALLAQWPKYRVLRMDLNTTRQKGAHRQAIQRFLDGEADILLGTQMIAKGLDFPRVTFVGVIAADTMLQVPDYRASERTFSLLTQVAGRAGRAEAKGTTVIQTYQPSHYAITAAAGHDYRSFYQTERALRESFRYPPFCELALFVATHDEANIAQRAAARFERELRRRLVQDETFVYPPVPSSIARVGDKYRYQVVVKYREWDAVRGAIVGAYELVDEKMRSFHGICTLDVNAGRI